MTRTRGYSEERLNRSPRAVTLSWLQQRMLSMRSPYGSGANTPAKGNTSGSGYASLDEEGANSPLRGIGGADVGFSSDEEL